jgi:hypothetical protein
MKDFNVHNPWSVCEWGPVPHIASRLTTIIGAFRFPFTGNLAKSESTENNMMLAGIPPLVRGATDRRWLGWSKCALLNQRRASQAYKREHLPIPEARLFGHNDAFNWPCPQASKGANENRD